jgi:hypothetical protein
MSPQAELPPDQRIKELALEASNLARSERYLTKELFKILFQGVRNLTQEQLAQQLNFNENIWPFLKKYNLANIDNSLRWWATQHWGKRTVSLTYDPKEELIILTSKSPDSLRCSTMSIKAHERDIPSHYEILIDKSSSFRVRNGHLESFDEDDSLTEASELGLALIAIATVQALGQRKVK